MSFVRAFAPATVANLGAGFDILGMAVQGPGDSVEVALRAEPGAVLLSVGGDDGGLLPRAAERNTATVAAAAVLRLAGADTGVEVRLHKGLPLNSGLGSSAASAVAAALATNVCLGEPLLREQLLPACLEAEAAVSGWHADNVAPALLGGICLICKHGGRADPAAADSAWPAVGAGHAGSGRADEAGARSPAAANQSEANGRADCRGRPAGRVPV